MMNKIIRTTLIALLLTFAAHAAAQQGLQIATVFQKYGKQKGVTMVELSNEMLETYQMTLYKSLVFKDASDALIGAHDTQTKLLSQEAGGGEMEMTFIMAHAQDTLMTTMILEKQARFTIDAYKRIAELEAKLA